MRRQGGGDGDLLQGILEAQRLRQREGRIGIHDHQRTHGARPHPVDQAGHRGDRGERAAPRRAPEPHSLADRAKHLIQDGHREMGLRGAFVLTLEAGRDRDRRGGCRELFPQGANRVGGNP
jgi:hypothetical protein